MSDSKTVIVRIKASLANAKRATGGETALRRWLYEHDLDVTRPFLAEQDQDDIVYTGARR
jgi:hypothetical protein